VCVYVCVCVYVWVFVCICVCVCSYVRVYIHMYCVLTYVCFAVTFCYRNVKCESKLEDYVRPGHIQIVNFKIYDH